MTDPRDIEAARRELANQHRDDFDPDTARPIVPRQFDTAEARDQLTAALQHHRPPYDSRPDTLAHSRRVGELMMQMIKEALDRSLVHDISKTEEPELAIFNQFTPLLKELEYGSTAYKLALKQMKVALDHHYANNAHHPEHRPGGIDDMTLVDLLEMLADWKAATERMADGDLEKSFPIQQERFAISGQLLQILENTARHFKWMPGQKTAAESARQMLDIQGAEGNWNYNTYMRGMYNGMELMLAEFEGREPIFRDPPAAGYKSDAKSRVVVLESPISDDGLIH